MDLIWIPVGIIVGIMLALIVVFCWLSCCWNAASCSSEVSERSTNRPSPPRLELPSPVSTPSWQGRQTHLVDDDLDDDIYIIRPQQRPSQPTPQSRPQYAVETERIFNQRTVVHKPILEVQQRRLQVQHLVEDDTPNRSEFERQQADEYAKRKNEFMRLLEKHRQAYEQQQQQAEAKRCSIEANKIEGKMIACNSRAAQAEIIFQKKNPSRRSVNFVDLHGLFVREAIEKLKKRIDLVKKLGSPHLTVCVGQGNHSQGEPKLKPAVMQYARKANIYYKVDSPNRGCIRLFFDEE